MPYRKFETSTWDKPWFEELSPRAKLLFIFLWTNTLCNQAGVYQISLKKIKSGVGFEPTKHLEELNPKVAWFPEEQIIWVRNFFKWQCQNASFALAAVKSMNGIPEEIRTEWFKQNMPYLLEKKDELKKLGYDIRDTLKEHHGDTMSPPTPHQYRTEQSSTEQKQKQKLHNGLSDHSSSAKAADCPHEKIIALWHEVLPELPRVRVWQGQRVAHLRARWREDKERQNLDWWRWLFSQKIRASPFLMGQVPGRDGKEPFLASLPWLILPENFAKVLEGFYSRALDTKVPSKILQSAIAGERWLKKGESKDE